MLVCCASLAWVTFKNTSQPGKGSVWVGGASRKGSNVGKDLKVLGSLMQLRLEESVWPNCWEQRDK